jgi:hypothetical protein
MRAACSWVTLLTFVLAAPWSLLAQERPKGKKKVDEPATEAKADKKSDDEKPKSKGSDDSGFGSARKKPKESDSKASKAKPGSKEERAIQKYKDDLTKRLEKQLKKGMSFYVVAVQEIAFEKAEGDVAPPPNVRVLPGGYYPGKPTIEVQVLEGREMALDYLVDYLTKYPPQQRPRSSKARRGEQAEPPGLPDPIRELLAADGFKEKEAAFKAQEQIQERIDAAERGPGAGPAGKPRGKNKPN